MQGAYLPFAYSGPARSVWLQLHATHPDLGRMLNRRKVAYEQVLRGLVSARQHTCVHV